MFKRLQNLRLSLAAKCELLFGAALVLVIAAAVSVPWLRMEQLTGQMNDRAADVLVFSALDVHVAYWKQQAKSPGQAASTRPTTAPTTEPTTAPATQPAAGTPLQWAPPHLLLLKDATTRANALDQRALVHFRKHPPEDKYRKLSSMDDNTYRYRYGRLVYMNEPCASCHSKDTQAAEGVVVPEGAFALASVDIPSQVEPNQLLLNRMFIFVAALLAGTLAGFFFYVIISRLILQPVRILQETAEKVSDGDLNIRTHIPSRDEFQVLSETFNRMLANLKDGEDQLRAINKSLDLKVEQMSESNLALYESNRLKSEFLANVSHELRTPLNSILGFAEILQESAKSDVKSARYVQNIMNSGRSLLELINDLLDLAKIEAGKMEVRSEPLSVSDLVEGLSNILRPLLEPKALSISPQVANDVPLMHTDGAKLQQVLYNFLSNAIKFSPPGGQIELIVQRQGEGLVRMAVRDRGPGIPLEKQQVIFEKFRQIDQSHTRMYSGTGLGLSISKELTHLLGGTIGVNSQPGEGATFWIILPIRIDPSTQDVRENAKAATAVSG